MEASAIPSTTVPDAVAVPRTAGKGLAAVLAMLLLIFAGTVVLRAPWRGHLAKGDSWVTGQALRFTRAWYAGDVVSMRGRLVVSPPTAEFEHNQQRKFGLPGYILLAWGILEPLGLEPTVARLMWINLGLHLLTALLLAVVAWCMARATWPEHDAAAALVALHCGAFVLLFPPLLYWGQNLCINDFLVVPLFAFVVAARWLRAGVTSRWGRAALDVAVVLCVVAGTLTEFLFWVLVPYLLYVRRRRARLGRPNTTDRAWLTVGLPFAVVVPLLSVVILFQGTLGFMIGRGGAWLVGDAGGSGVGILTMIVGRPMALSWFLFGHFADAFGVVGFFALGLGLLRVLRHDRLPGLPPAVRGILVDLLAPCLIITVLLAAHASMHTFAAMKFVPFIALAWTVLTPFLVGRMRSDRRLLVAPVYAAVALLVLSPMTSEYPDFFPAPESFWDRQGAFLREHTLPTDRVFSPTTEIELVPPQPIALAERRVGHVYGPLDIFIGPPDGTNRKLGFFWWPPVNLDTTMALYGPRTLYRKFGADRAEVVTDGDLSLVRMPVRDMVPFLASRPDAHVRRRLLEVLSGGLRDAGDPRPRILAVAPLNAPIAMHLIQGLEKTLVYDRLYWTDARHFHWKSTDLEFVVRGKERHQSMWGGFWVPVQATPDPRVAEWGTLVMGLFQRAADDARAGTQFPWWGYDVIVMPVDAVPEVLRAAAPGVARWEAYLIYKDAKPVAAALGPARGGAGSDSLNWVCILLDEPVVDIGVPVEVFEPWRVRGHAVDPDEERADG
jgi:hypothetical protein